MNYFKTKDGAVIASAGIIDGLEKATLADFNAFVTAQQKSFQQAFGMPPPNQAPGMVPVEQNGG